MGFNSAFKGLSSFYALFITKYAQVRDLSYKNDLKFCTINSKCNQLIQTIFSIQIVALFMTGCQEGVNNYTYVTNTGIVYDVTRKHVFSLQAKRSLISVLEQHNRHYLQ